MNPFYSAPRPEFSPGDVFIDVPSVYLANAEVTYVRRRTGPKGRPLADLFVLGNEDPKPSKVFSPAQDEIISPTQYAPAVLLTNGCEIDNRPRACLSVGIVRPMQNVPDDARDAIRQGRNLSFFWLPANDEPELEESYVDFSRITSVRREVLEARPRILSGSDTLVKALYVGLVRYYTRLDLPDDLVAQLAADAIAG